jgi:hypothetical protein
LLRIALIFLFKEAYFYANLLQVTSRCAIRGIIYSDSTTVLTLLVPPHAKGDKAAQQEFKKTA